VAERSQARLDAGPCRGGAEPPKGCARVARGLAWPWPYRHQGSYPLSPQRAKL